MQNVLTSEWTSGEAEAPRRLVLMMRRTVVVVRGTS
jgi:hypothetical protein